MNSSPLRAVIERLTCQFQAHAVDSPRLSAEILLAKAMDMERADLLRHMILYPDARIPEQQLTLAESYARRRSMGEPVAYILGIKEFYSRDFIVTPAVLIPRPETELLVDLALDFIRSSKELAGKNRPAFADFGSGSGCIGITIALARPSWRGLALDISADALAVAGQNVERHGVRNLTLLRADFAAAPIAPGSLHILVTNPPYVSEDEYRQLTREVRDFEPKSALVPGSARNTPPLGAQLQATGLEDALAIIRQAADLLCPGGLLLMETGRDQVKDLLGALAGASFAKAAVHKDYAGLNRVVAAHKRS